MSEPQSFTCPRCTATSHNPNDVREGYCGVCHAFTGQLADHAAVARALKVAARQVDPRWVV